MCNPNSFVHDSNERGGVGRASSIELLRIISMIAIIASHYIGQGGAATNTTGLNQAISTFFLIGGKWGVNVFQIISSWFMVDHESKPNNIFRTWFTVFFYQVSFCLLFYAIGEGETSIGILIKSFFPVIGNLNWYVTTYFGFVLLSPYLRQLLNLLPMRDYIKMLITMAMMISILPTFLEMKSYFNDLIWFVFIYMAVGYFKRYPLNILENKYFCLGCFALNIAIIFILNMACNANFLPYEHNYFSNEFSLFQFGAAIGCFYLFRNLQLSESKIINSLACHVWGIFILHTVYPIRYEWLWNRLLNCKDFYISDFFAVHLIVCVVLIFAVCVVLDTIYKMTVEKVVINSNFTRTRILPLIEKILCKN